MPFTTQDFLVFYRKQGKGLETANPNATVCFACEEKNRKLR
jgi:hypothetical protein